MQTAHVLLAFPGSKSQFVTLKAMANGALDVFREPAYARFWLARVCSTMSYQIAGVAVGWQVYALTHSTLALGMLGLAQFLPMLLLVLVVGQVADRFNRRKVLAICQSIESLTALVLTGATLLHRVDERGIFVAVVVIGAARAFEFPSMQALVPSLVEESKVPKAIALSSSAVQTATILGPALGGVLYALGAQIPYACCGGLYLLAALLSISIPLRRKTLASAPGSRSIFSGIHYIRSHRSILGAISLDLFVVLLGGATALLPAFAHDILKTGPWGLGLLRLSPALGALAASFWLAHHPLGEGAGRKMFAAVVVFGLATIGFALSHQIWLSILLLMVLGASDVVSVVVRSSLVQLETPDEMRGRVSAVNSLFIGTSNQLGEFESGVTASCFGLVPATILGGVGSMVIAALWIRFFPELWRLKRLKG